MLQLCVPAQGQRVRLKEGREKVSKDKGIPDVPLDLLHIIGFFVFFPLLWLINTALKPSSETFSTYFFLGPLTLDNIIHIVTDPKICLLYTSRCV